MILTILILAICIASIISAISNTFGVQCYNNNKEYKNNNISNYNFMITTVVFSIFAAIVSLFLIYAIK
jgi:di/tricarboxylate transporter